MSTYMLCSRKGKEILYRSYEYILGDVGGESVCVYISRVGNDVRCGLSGERRSGYDCVLGIDDARDGFDLFSGVVDDVSCRLLDLGLCLKVVTGINRGAGVYLRVGYAYGKEYDLILGELERVVNG